ncbi:hypothetical protein D3C85_1489480 [compost metagenome]
MHALAALGLLLRRCLGYHRGIYPGLLFGPAIALPVVLGLLLRGLTLGRIGHRFRLRLHAGRNHCDCGAEHHPPSLAVMHDVPPPAGPCARVCGLSIAAQGAKSNEFLRAAY